MKRFAIIFSIWIYSVYNPFAQVEFVSIDITGNLGRTNLVFFDDYAAAYNKTLKPSLSKELGNMRWSYGQSIGLSMHANVLYADFVWENKFGSTTSHFIDQSLGVRHFDVRHSTKSISLGYVGGDDYDWYFSVAYHFGIDQVFIDSYKKYPSGDISFGGENYTNGKYRGSNFNMGIKGDFYKPLNDRIWWNTGFKLGFSLNGQDMREANDDDKGLYLPGVYWDEGIPAMVRYFTIHFGFRIALYNDL